MQRRPYTPPKLRRLSLEDVRELERRHGVPLLGNHDAGELEREPLPKGGGHGGEA